MQPKRNRFPSWTEFLGYETMYRKLPLMTNSRNTLKCNCTMFAFVEDFSAEVCALQLITADPRTITTVGGINP